MPSSVDDYEVIGMVGKGSYGTCKKIKRKSDGKIFVWKELDYGLMSESEKHMLVAEVNLLRELRHRHIVRYYDRVVNKSTATIYIIMEHCEGGDLERLINKCKVNKKLLDEDFVWKILHQLALALRTCHRCKVGRTVLHRDIKPANVFLDSTNDVKLGDFGLSRILAHDSSFAKTFVGTPYYMSPEQMNNELYNEKSDIWSLGCLMYELCMLTPPFLAPNQRALKVKIQQGRYRRIPMAFSDDLNTIVSWMLTVQDNKRPSIEELLNDSRMERHVQKLDASDDSNNKREQAIRLKELSLKQKEENLFEKENSLREKKRRLAEREKDIERRERELEARERLAEKKLSVAKSLVQQHGECISTSTGKSPDCPLDGSTFCHNLSLKSTFAC
ncbi:PREDICTED: serine/threonine-protein kinase Nek2-like [Priapulus caudatus]|uniref:non-specific serine/threonine protein kinase n=1 Tax=Priapulus caudatus TaxID=37621 RepID=A0ABM1EBS4_PRICU|nr:PREDICTED: serine/threonine-protein kinase Nek2-like [Priapulus caudatus]